MMLTRGRWEVWIFGNPLYVELGEGMMYSAGVSAGG